MPLSINTNIASLNAQRHLVGSNQNLETAYERLASGKRVNSASDDAAGLAIGKAMEARVSGLNQAVRNANDGVSMVAIAEGALDEVTTILQRMRDLAVQAASDNISSTERVYLENEKDSLVSTLDTVVAAAKFNGESLVNSSGVSKTIQIGADATSSDKLTLTIGAMSASTLTVDGSNIDLTATTGGAKELTTFGVSLAQTLANNDDYTLTIDGVAISIATTGGYSSLADIVTDLNAATLSGTQTLASIGYEITAAAGGIGVLATATGAKTDGLVSFGFTAGGADTVGEVGSAVVATQGAAAVNSGGAAAISTIDTALADVATKRAALGATQAQLESTVRNLSNVAENTAAAVGRIMDTDYAAETANLTKAQILQQAATSVLAQANAQPQAVLSLLQ